jgi:aspartate aminotransferase-like enzyme
MNTSLLGVNSKKVKIDSITSDILCDIVENYLNTSTNIQMAVFEHITSPTAILLPIERFALICKKYNVLTLIDGAHGIGQ